MLSKLIKVLNTPNETADILEKKGLFEKCVIFVGDNCNTVFGGQWHHEEGQDTFANLKKLLQQEIIIGVGFPPHILKN